jgi:hypothetical protein
VLQLGVLSYCAAVAFVTVMCRSVPSLLDVVMQCTSVVQCAVPRVLHTALVVCTVAVHTTRVSQPVSWGAGAHYERGSMDMLLGKVLRAGVLILGRV